MADDLGVRYADLLSGSFDCAGRIVLTAVWPFGCFPGGPDLVADAARRVR
jgi:hypothetical protein